LHSSVPSVVAVYATLRWQSARFRCRPPTSSPSTLHLFWASTSPCTEPRFQEPTRSCFLLAFYTKLSQSSTRVWPVILTSLHSPVGTGRDAAGFQRRAGKLCSPVFTVFVFPEQRSRERASNIVVEVPAQVQLQKDKVWLVAVCFVVAPPCTTLRQKIIVVHESNS